LQPFHFGRSGGSFVIKTSQVKKPVRNVQAQLVGDGVLIAAGVVSRCFNAYKNLAVLKRNNICWAGKIKESTM